MISKLLIKEDEIERYVAGTTPSTPYSVRKCYK